MIKKGYKVKKRVYLSVYSVENLSCRTPKTVQNQRLMIKFQTTSMTGIKLKNIMI